MSGERDGDRRVMDGLKKDLLDAGVKPHIADEKARKAMREVDRRLREQGKR